MLVRCPLEPVEAGDGVFFFKFQASWFVARVLIEDFQKKQKSMKINVYEALDGKFYVKKQLGNNRCK